MPSHSTAQSANVDAQSSPTSIPPVRVRDLIPADSLLEYELHRDALEWSLAEPIIIESAEDIKSRLKWRERLDPFAHQVRNLMTFCRRLPVTIIADDVGLGKTISAGLILSELMERRRISRTLIFCPKILIPQWIEELNTKFGIVAKEYTGDSLAAGVKANAEVIVTTYDSGRKHLPRLVPGTFDMIILDEAHKVRNLRGSKDPPKVATAIYSALESRLFKYVLMLTATPLQNRLWDIYSLVDCLSVAKGHRNPFGSTDEFRARYIADGMTARRLNPDRAEEFREILRRYMVRTRREDAQLLFPERQVQMFQRPATPVDAELQRIVADHIHLADPLVQSSLAKAMMSSPEALVSQLDRMATRAPIWNPAATAVRALIVGRPATAKEQSLLDLIEQLRANAPDEWRVLVFTTRLETQNAIGRLLANRGVKFGFIAGSQPVVNTRTIQGFMADPPQLNVIVSTDAGAEGVNLQKCNVVVNFDLPWNPMVVEQRIGRVQRLASKAKSVFVVNLVVANSPEHQVVARLMEKLQLIAHTVGDIESVLGDASDGDSGQTFEAQIRKLVVQALVGQDVAMATQLAVQSIEEARNLLETQKEEMDRALGRLDEMHHSGPRMPKLSPTQPRRPYKDFVLTALQAETGVVAEQKQNDVFTFTGTDVPRETITFSEAYWRQQGELSVFMGTTVRLYLPGKPAFERLVQRWLARGGCAIQEAVGWGRLEFAQNWLRGIDGAELLKIDAQIIKRCGQWHATVRAVASNAVDSYEKLLDVSCGDHDYGSLLPMALSEARLTTEVPKATYLSEMIAEPTAQMLRQDVDLGSFAGFYRARLHEELQSAGADEVRSSKVKTDFTPVLRCELEALRGTKMSVDRLTVHYHIDGAGHYLSEIECVPATGRLLREPEWTRCEHTGKFVPLDCLAACALSGKNVLRGLLVTSTISGRQALDCFVSVRNDQVVAFVDETMISAISGRALLPGMAIVSPISGRIVARDEADVCEFTEQLLPVDELEVSQVSGRKYRGDESATSAISGISGHKSEFRECQFTQQLILPEEGLVSDFSGKFGRRDMMFRSDKPPQRIGAAEELVTCSVSGNRLLLDEVVLCSATNQYLDASLARFSDVSGRPLAPAAAIVCSKSGSTLHPDESLISEATGEPLDRRIAVKSEISDRWAHADEMAVCEITGVRLIPDELVASDYSGKRFRQDQAIRSEASQRLIHESESVKCSYSGQVIAVDETAKSEVTGNIFSNRLVGRSEKSGRIGYAPTELQICEVSGRKLLSDELERSVVSGRLVDAALLSGSPASGRKALNAEMEQCPVSGVLLLPDELDYCHITRQKVDRRRLKASEMSGKLGLEEQMVRCAGTKSYVLPDEAAKCSLSGKLVRKDELAQCCISKVIGCKRLMVKSDASGRYCIKQHAVRSRTDNRQFVKDEVVICRWLRDYIPKAEAAHCKLTGALVAQRLLNADGELAPFRALLDRPASGSKSDTELNRIAGLLPAEIPLPKAAWISQSPRGVEAVVIEFTELMGLKRWQLAYLKFEEKLLSPILIGRRTLRGLQLSESVKSFEEVARP